MNGLQWSCSERSFPLAPLDVALRLIGGMKFGTVDLSVSESSLHLPLTRMMTQPKELTSKVRALLRERSLMVADVRFDVPIPDAQGAAAMIDFAASCGAGHTTLACSGEHAFESVRLFANEAQKNRIKAAADAWPGVSPADFRAMVREIPELSVSLDYGAFLENGFAEEEVNTLLPMTTHLRIRGTHAGSYQAAWKENSVDYMRTLRALQTAGYAGFVAADYVWQPEHGRNRNDVIAETIQMRNWFEQALSASQG